MPSSASRTALGSTLRFIRNQHAAFRFFISILLFAIVGVLLSVSSPFEASSEMLWALKILLVILIIIYVHDTLFVMPSFQFPSSTQLLRFIAQHVGFGVVISTLFDFIGMCFLESSLFEETYVRLWAVILCLFIYNAHIILQIIPYVQITSIAVADLLWFIPRHDGFRNLIEELSSMVQRRFPNSSPLAENSARTWTFIASRSIYRCTGDIISGSLACAVLISFLISPHETPIYVFFIWAICVVYFLKNNGAVIPGN